MSIYLELRLCSYACTGDDPREYSWWIEGTHNGKDWVRIADDRGSNYDTAKEMVAAFNRENVERDLGKGWRP